MHGEKSKWPPRHCWKFPQCSFCFVVKVCDVDMIDRYRWSVQILVWSLFLHCAYLQCFRGGGGFTLHAEGNLTNLVCKVSSYTTSHPIACVIRHCTQALENIHTDLARPGVMGLIICVYFRKKKFLFLWNFGLDQSLHVLIFYINPSMYILVTLSLAPPHRHTKCLHWDSREDEEHKQAFFSFFFFTVFRTFTKFEQMCN